MIDITTVFYDIGQGSWMAMGFAEATAFQGSDDFNIPISVNCAKWMISRGCVDVTPEKHSAMIPDSHSIY